MNLEGMNVQELVSVLRTAFLTEEFDRIEGILVSRYKRLENEIIDLQEKVEMEKKTRFQAEEDLRKREELCEKGKRAQNNYEKLLKEVKKTNLAEKDTIGELRKKNNELELEVCELRKLKEKWVNDSKNAYGVRKSELLEKSMKKNIEALGIPLITNFEIRDEESEYEIDNDTMEPNTLQTNEPPNKRSKNAQGASSVMTQTRGATIDSHSRHGHPIASREFAARHVPIVEERRENDNIHMSEEVIVTDNVVVPLSYVQEQMATQYTAKRKKVATNPSFSNFDNFHFTSSVHQERYSEFLANKKFVEEKNFRLEGNKFLDIQVMIVSRGWVELTSFAKDASTTLAKEFFANAYQGPAKNERMKFTSFIRGKNVPFHDNIINELFGLENYEQCSFEARKAKGSNIDHQEIRSTLCRPEADWVRNKDGTPTKLRTSDLTPLAKVWAMFVLRTLLPCSNVSDLTILKANLLTAILKGEPVNVGRLLADDLWVTANCSSPSSYINHASLIRKLCERVKVYPKKKEEMVKPSGAITAKWIETHCSL